MPLDALVCENTGPPRYDWQHVPRRGCTVALYNNICSLGDWKEYFKTIVLATLVKVTYCSCFEKIM